MTDRAAYAKAFRIWADWFVKAEIAGRTAPHMPAAVPARGVRPLHRHSATQRATKRLRLEAARRDYQLRDIPTLLSERAREDARGAHEHWLSDNPCPCDDCGGELAIAS